MNRLVCSTEFDTIAMAFIHHGGDEFHLFGNQLFNCNQ